MEEPYHIQHRRVKGYDSCMNRTLLAYLIAFVGGLLGMYVYTTDKTAAAREGLIASCERVNTLRAQSNITDLSVWRNFSAAVQRETKLAKGPDGELHQKSADEIAKNAEDIAVTPLTNCSQAVDHPTTYKPPRAGKIGNVRTGRQTLRVEGIELQSKQRVEHPPH